ncbi:Zinc finger CCHC domain-containing protein 10 [Zea mays]|uniref:Zinc finger CCHC domain-containing protein 10 n=1 Tax=Zea mays TaxID=4577 RepID=A0A3L6FPE4_MAIZE|nr:Zinc finger CCHC domain-containing protein 10 [Zea mays]
MSGNDDKPHAAADRIKAATLSVAKGLSRAQAERAATAAARNVNAYGQKEEGPSRWQERKEAKRQMYLMSTEKAAKLGTVKPKASETSSVGAYTQCQKCFQHGHWTYECKNERVYISRPSRTQQLKNPKLKKSVPVSYQFENPDIIKEREEEQKMMKEKQKKEKAERKKGKSKRKHRSPSDSDSSNSAASVFDSDSESSGSEYSSGTSSSYSSSDSEDKKRQHRRKQKKRRHRRDSTSSSSSESESASDSDSDDKNSRRKSKRRGGRR